MSRAAARGPARRAPARLLAVMALLAAAAPALAHMWGVTRAAIEVPGDGTFQVDLYYDVGALLDAEGHEALAADELYLMLDERFRLRDGLRRELAARLQDSVRILFDGRAAATTVGFPDLEAGIPPRRGALPGSHARLAGRVPGGAGSLRVRFDPVLGDVLGIVSLGPGRTMRRIAVAAGEASEPVRLDGSTTEPFARVAWRYTVLGFEHILPLGLDHILFVVGLYLLNTRLRSLLAQVTAFTVAHSVTLALSMFGWISLPSSVVEPLIALSIAYVALENVATPELKPWRPAVVFGFGLLHGLGFAGVLRDLGLPRGDFLTALLSFNVGVELGQLAVIALAFALSGWLRSRSWYRLRLAVPASLAIAAVGLYWTVERLFLS